MTVQRPARFTHFLGRNEGCATPSRLVFLDTETYPAAMPGQTSVKLHQLRLWCASTLELRQGKVTRRQEAQGQASASFWEWLYEFQDPRKPVWLWCHNAGFDLTTAHFWHELERGTFVLAQTPEEQPRLARGALREPWQGQLVTNSPPFICVARWAKTVNKLVCVDSLNWWKCSLAELAASVGLVKGAMPAWDAGDAEWFAYCKQDVAILERAVVELLRFTKAEDMGNFRYTAAAQAFACYRHRFMQTPVVIHAHEEATKLERESYLGGECRAFYIGDVVAPEEWLKSNQRRHAGWSRPTTTGPVHCLDVNSFYPFLMRQGRYPCRLKGYAVMPGEDNLKRWLERFCLVARVQVDTPDLPLPARKDGKTFMARGRFVTTLCTPEIELALAHKVKLKIGAVAYYETDSIFAEFVEWVLALRARYQGEGNRVWEHLAKLLGNSLFGKFGQLEGKWLDRPEMFAPEPWGEFWDVCPETKKPRQFRAVNDFVQARGQKQETKDSFPAIPAHVTSYGRVYMHQLREQAGVKHVLYQDTDSLHVTPEGLENLTHFKQLHPSHPGKLKETHVARAAAYYGLKYYRLDNEWVIAGVKKDAEEVRPGVFRQLEFCGLDTMLSKCAPLGVPVREVEIDRSDEVVPGRVRPDGRVETLQLKEY